MKRTGYEIDDIQSCYYQMLKALTAAPWSSWNVIRGWPEIEVFNNPSKPFIYVMPPVSVEDWMQQAGGIAGTIWEMIIGCWDGRLTGGPEEIQIIGSQLLALFNNPVTLNKTNTFNVTLGATTYTATELLSQGIETMSIRGPRDIATEDQKEFRSEFTVSLLT